MQATSINITSPSPSEEEHLLHNNVQNILGASKSSHRSIPKWLSSCYQGFSSVFNWSKRQVINLTQKVSSLYTWTVTNTEQENPSTGFKILKGGLAVTAASVNIAALTTMGCNFQDEKGFAYPTAAFVWGASLNLFLQFTFSQPTRRLINNLMARHSLNSYFALAQLTRLLSRSFMVQQPLVALLVGSAGYQTILYTEATLKEVLQPEEIGLEPVRRQLSLLPSLEADPLNKKALLIEQAVKGTLALSALYLSYTQPRIPFMWEMFLFVSGHTLVILPSSIYLTSWVNEEKKCVRNGQSSKKVQMLRMGAKLIKLTKVPLLCVSLFSFERQWINDLLIFINGGSPALTKMLELHGFNRIQYTESGKNYIKERLARLSFHTKERERVYQILQAEGNHRPSTYARISHLVHRGTKRLFFAGITAWLGYGLYDENNSHVRAIILSLAAGIGAGYWLNRKASAEFAIQNINKVSTTPVLNLNNRSQSLISKITRFFKRRFINTLDFYLDRNSEFTTAFLYIIYKINTDADAIKKAPLLQVLLASIAYYDWGMEMGIQNGLPYPSLDETAPPSEAALFLLLYNYSYYIERFLNSHQLRLPSPANDLSFLPGLSPFHA
jgi:hypothetical protein